jgi:DDB1- and CUL4-associated factor 13
MYPSNSRQNGFRDLSRSPNGLPVFTSSIHEKKLRHAKASSWTISIYLPIPGLRNRHLHIILPNLSLFHRFTLSHFSRRRGTLVLLLTCVSLIFTIFAIAQRFRTQEKQWAAPLFPGEPPTLVFGREDLQKIWRWEVQSGHYPSSRASAFFVGTLTSKRLHRLRAFFPVPKAIGMTVPPLNPALPPRKVAKIPSRFRPPGAAVGETIGHGSKRVYLDVQARPPNVAYPPRPVPGSVADLDIIMDLCDFPSKVFVPRVLLVLMRLIFCHSMSATAWRSYA